MHVAIFHIQVLTYTSTLFPQLCCPCCVPTTEWRINSQGIRWRKNPASIDCCGEVETQLIDFRFLKDIEFRKDPKFCCCCLDAKTLLYADDKDTTS